MYLSFSHKQSNLKFYFSWFSISHEMEVSCDRQEDGSGDLDLSTAKILSFDYQKLVKTNLTQTNPDDDREGLYEARVVLKDFFKNLDPKRVIEFEAVSDGDYDPEYHQEILEKKEPTNFNDIKKELISILESNFSNVVSE